MNDEILYTPEELSKKLKLSKYTVYEMIKRGDIKAHHIGRSIRISESQLELYLLNSGKSENIFTCEIVGENDEIYALVNNVKVSVSTDIIGDAKISIPPEDVILSVGAFVSSARNMHLGKVSNIVCIDHTCKVLLNVGFPLLALITKRSMEEMKISKGMELYAVFKTMSVKVIKNERT